MERHNQQNEKRIFFHDDFFIVLQLHRIFVPVYCCAINIKGITYCGCIVDVLCTTRLSRLHISFVRKPFHEHVLVGNWKCFLRSSADRNSNWLPITNDSLRCTCHVSNQPYLRVRTLLYISSGHIHNTRMRNHATYSHAHMPSTISSLFARTIRAVTYDCTL